MLRDVEVEVAELVNVSPTFWDALGDDNGDADGACFVPVTRLLLR